MPSNALAGTERDSFVTRFPRMNRLANKSEWFDRRVGLTCCTSVSTLVNGSIYNNGNIVCFHMHTIVHGVKCSFMKGRERF